jgi:superfamily II DNA or RNA helicase
MFTLRPHQQRGVDSLEKNDKGQILIPTGGGKTLIAIMDAKKQLETKPSTIVVVCPRILLAEQLCSEFMEVIDPHNSDPYLHILHVHSGETHYTSTTNVDKINVYANCARNMGENCIIFTTYHSLHRVQEADIEVNTIYFDEAHNSVQRHFFPATEYFSNEADRAYFFTATRKTSVIVNKPGMNDQEVYGDIICRVSAPELVQGGYIIPPRIKAKTFDIQQTKLITPEVDCGNVLETIDDTDTKKILVCVKTSRQLINLMSHTDFATQLTDRGYSYLYITSKTGAVIDGKKTDRETFFNTLNAWGKDSNKKFVCLHRSILSEGISINQLETVIFLRNMNVIEMTQTIGRVLRVGKDKAFGLVVVPIYTKVGIATERALQSVVDTVFERGELLDSVTRK